MSEERRKQLLAILRAGAGLITGGELAARLGVSRQIIVQDVALLRARGEDLIATPLGYVLAERRAAASHRALIACRHNREATRDELTILVDIGVKVVDVIVEHPLYGEMRAALALESRDDVDQFIARLEESGAELLSTLTDGVHLHTIEAPKPEALPKAQAALRERGYLLD